MSTRVIGRPLDVDPCECGGHLVDELANGLTHRYNCIDCGQLLAEFCRKATP